MQAQTGNCTILVQMEGHRIIGYETSGTDWRYGQLVSHAIFEAVEKTADALKAKPARKRPKMEPRQEPAVTPKIEPRQEPAVKAEPREKPAKKVNKARDRPVKTETGLVDLVSEEEDGEYVEDKEWI